LKILLLCSKKKNSRRRRQKRRQKVAASRQMCVLRCCLGYLSGGSWLKGAIRGGAKFAGGRVSRQFGGCLTVQAFCRRTWAGTDG
ncbi:MAG: hypothetical protein LBN95_01385, partial [Prevotellaceae bacterium]|nr:hypothetical protein [Prevotellaceae bacterium]